MVKVRLPIANIAVPNNARVTLACFLAYFVMSGMLSPIGIILPGLAAAVSLEVTDAAALFSWLTVGILLGSALALGVFDLMGMRAWMLLLYLAIAASLLALRLGDSLWVLRLGLGVVGTACGIGLAAAAGSISLLYSEDRRASMLVITDGSFSVAGILISSLAVAFAARELHWASTYLLVAVVAVVIAALAALSQFPQAPVRPPAQQASRDYWPAAVWLSIAALFLYTLGQYSLLWWLPTYLENELGAERDQAGDVVARFWTGMFIAQVLVAWWVLRIGARRLVLLSVVATFLGSLPLWNVTTLSLLPWLSLAWGVANLGLLKIVIAFATLSVPHPTPRLVAALLFGATSGTAVSPMVTSTVVELGSSRTVLQFGSLCYLVLATLIIVAWWITRRDGSRARGERAETVERRDSGESAVG